MAAKNMVEAGVRVSLAMDEGSPPPHRILVADEDAQILRLNTKTLIKAGYDVDWTADGVMAWNAIQGNHYDLFLTENHLPKLSGLDLLRNIHLAEIDLPVIMATSRPPGEQPQRPPWLQIAAILLKPYTADELLAVIRNVFYAIEFVPDTSLPPPEWEGRPSAPDHLRF